MTNKKLIYGIEFEEHGKSLIATSYSYISKQFKIYVFEYENRFSVFVNFSENTVFQVERNTIEQTFFDFFSLCPNLIKTKEFDDISSTFFENYKKELDDKIERITFDDFDKTLPSLPDIENIDVSQIESKECVIRRNNK